MRTSEKIAVAAVVAMVLPAFLAFPALGAAYVVRVWPGLDLIKRSVFLCSVAMTFVTVPLVFRRHLDLIFRGETERLSLSEQLLLAVPFVAGAWALTDQWVMAFLFTFWKAVFWGLKFVGGTRDGSTPSAYEMRSDSLPYRPRREGRMRQRMHGRRWAVWIQERLGRR